MAIDPSTMSGLFVDAIVVAGSGCSSMSGIPTFGSVDDAIDVAADGSYCIVPSITLGVMPL